jgi:hypothetical protein
MAARSLTPADGDALLDSLGAAARHRLGAALAAAPCDSTAMLEAQSALQAAAQRALQAEVAAMKRQQSACGSAPP